MAGNTATISVERFRADWCAHTPIVQLCQAYTITKDQVIRLRDLWRLPLRNDRRLRSKPERSRDPTPAEIRAATERIQATWDDRTREMRRVSKPQAVSVQRVRVDHIDMQFIADEPAESLIERMCSDDQPE